MRNTNDLISRDYAIAQMKKAMEESEDENEREQFSRFIDFLAVLPIAYVGEEDGEDDADTPQTKLYRVTVAYGGTVDIEVEAGNLTEAKYKAENAFDQLSDRKLIANISDFIAEDAEEIA